MNKLTEMLPPFAQEYREFNVIHEAILPELEQLRQEQQEILDAQFIMTCPEKYMFLWERELGITDGEQYDLLTRRMNCLKKKNDILPYNRKKINDRVYAIVPKQYCDITWAKNWIRVKVHYDYAQMIPYIRDMLDEALPLNMVIYVEVKKATNRMLEKYRHMDLEPYTHDEITMLLEDS